MARQQSQKSLTTLGFARNEEEARFEVITVDSPVGGFYSLGNTFPLPANALTVCINNTFQSFALEKRPGITKIGQSLTFPTYKDPWWGGMLLMNHPTSPPTDQITLVRINGFHTLTGFLVKLNDDDPNPVNWRWVGVLSGLESPTVADQVTDGYGLATAIVQAKRLFIADGGVRRKVFLFGTSPNKIKNWGLNVGTPSAPTISSEGTAGFLLSDRNYAIQYQVIDEETGFKSEYSPVSNVWLTTNPGDTCSLNCSIPAFGTLPSGTYTIRVARSTGAVPPSDPAKYLIDSDFTGITNLQTTPYTFTLTKLDGDIGPSELTQVYPLAPQGRVVMRDPSGDRALILCDPTAPNVVYWSEEGNYGNWPPVNQTLPIADDECDVLSAGFVGLNGRVFVMKRRRGIYEMQLTVNGAYTPVLIADSTGCWSHHSIVCKNGTYYWFSLEGVIRFDGAQPVNISDAKIRQFFKEITLGNEDLLNGDLGIPYGIPNTRTGINNVEWFVRNPTTNGIYRLKYDINLDNWSLDVIGDGQPTIGGNSIIQFLGREDATVQIDPQINDGLDHIYYCDGAGSCYKSWFDDNRVEGQPIYSDCGSGYTWDVRTAWYGNGVDMVLTRYLDFLLATRPPVSGSSAAGLVTVSLYVDGSDTAAHSTQFLIPLESDYPGAIYVPFRYRADSFSQPCRMFRFGWSNSGAGERPLVPWYEIRYNVNARRMRGLQIGG